MCCWSARWGWISNLGFEFLFKCFFLLLSYQGGGYHHSMELLSKSPYIYEMLILATAGREPSASLTMAQTHKTIGLKRILQLIDWIGLTIYLHLMTTGRGLSRDLHPCRNIFRLNNLNVIYILIILVVQNRKGLLNFE